MVLSPRGIPQFPNDSDSPVFSSVYLPSQDWGTDDTRYCGPRAHPVDGSAFPACAVVLAGVLMPETKPFPHRNGLYRVHFISFLRL